MKHLQVFSVVLVLLFQKVVSKPCINQNINQDIRGEVKGEVNQIIKQDIVDVPKDTGVINQNIRQDVISKCGNAESINQNIQQKIKKGSCSVNQKSIRMIKNHEKRSNCPRFEDIIFRRHLNKCGSNSFDSSEEIKICDCGQTSDIYFKNHEDRCGSISEESSEEITIKYGRKPCVTSEEIVFPQCNKECGDSEEIIVKEYRSKPNKCTHDSSEEILLCGCGKCEETIKPCYNSFKPKTKCFEKCSDLSEFCSCPEDCSTEEILIKPCLKPKIKCSSEEFFRQKCCEEKVVEPCFKSCKQNSKHYSFNPKMKCSEERFEKYCDLGCESYFCDGDCSSEEILVKPKIKCSSGESFEEFFRQKYISSEEPCFESCSCNQRTKDCCNEDILIKPCLSKIKCSSEESFEREECCDSSEETYKPCFDFPDECCREELVKPCFNQKNKCLFEECSEECFRDECSDSSEETVVKSCSESRPCFKPKIKYCDENSEEEFYCKHIPDDYCGEICLFEEPCFKPKIKCSSTRGWNCESSEEQIYKPCLQSCDEIPVEPSSEQYISSEYELLVPCYKSSCPCKDSYEEILFKPNSFEESSDEFFRKKSCDTDEELVYYKPY